MRSIRFAAALLLSTAIATPALAQRSATKPGNYVDVSAVKILPGQFENYMDFLKSQWAKQQEWAKQKGYIVSYRILANTYPRADEPSIYLLTEYATIPTNAEIERRQEEYVAMMKMDEHAMDAASEKRGPMRTIGSQTQLQEIVLK
jgi:hypothetical protein